jgi:F0F1-type ATP synthase alpha subunit
MGIWEQVASVLAVNTGAFDAVPSSKVKHAQAALITRLWTDHKEEMRALNKGDKPTDDTLKLIEKTAKAVAKGFEE